MATNFEELRNSYFPPNELAQKLNQKIQNNENLTSEEEAQLNAIRQFPDNEMMQKLAYKEKMQVETNEELIDEEKAILCAYRMYPNDEQKRKKFEVQLLEELKEEREFIRNFREQITEKAS